MIVRQLRSLRRLALFAFALIQVLADCWILSMRWHGAIPSPERAQWLHRSCTTILRRLGMRVSVEGPPPECGLLVSNHLSYLDILFYAAVMPCVFVAKSEVRSWPCFGLLARCAGTVFIDRSRSASTSQAADEMQRLLDDNITVLLFPEGTSSDGSAVLCFHPSLFDPAVVAGMPVTSSAISYASEDGSPESVLCYYGDDTFGPHLLRTLGAGVLSGHIDFAPEAQRYPDRKTAAAACWRQVAQLREARLAMGTQAAVIETVDTQSDLARP
jgi:1-acyl-sn-glycerol-3-phosphate acyltransferase